MAKSAPPEARVEFEAFLEAAIVSARAAVHRLKSKYEKHEYWKECWDGLLDEAAVNFFRLERDWILKEAPPKIGQKVFAPFIGPEGAEHTHVPLSAAEFYYFEDPSTPATATVEKHLNTLAGLVTEAERRFTRLGRPNKRMQLADASGLRNFG